MASGLTETLFVFGTPWSVGFLHRPEGRVQLGTASRTTFHYPAAQLHPRSGSRFSPNFTTQGQPSLPRARSGSGRAPGVLSRAFHRVPVPVAEACEASVGFFRVPSGAAGVRTLAAQVERAEGLPKDSGGAAPQQHRGGGGLEERPSGLRCSLVLPSGRLGTMQPNPAGVPQFGPNGYYNNFPPPAALISTLQVGRAAPLESTMAGEAGSLSTHGTGTGRLQESQQLQHSPAPSHRRGHGTHVWQRRTEEEEKYVATPGAPELSSGKQGSELPFQFSLSFGVVGGLGESSDGRPRKRFVWPEALHQDFVTAIFDVGLKCSTLGKIQEFTNATNAEMPEDMIHALLAKFRYFRQAARERGEDKAQANDVAEDGSVRADLEKEKKAAEAAKRNRDQAKKEEAIRRRKQVRSDSEPTDAVDLASWAAILRDSMTSHMEFVSEIEAALRRELKLQKEMASKMVSSCASLGR
eukprot:scaffold977_cov253-Pinguiococcus_pyrenoidosus.AAC.45